MPISGNNKIKSMIVSQLGARMHYAVPRIFYDAGALAHFYTDICASKGWPRLFQMLPSSLCPQGLKRLKDRVPESIPPAKIDAFTNFGFEYWQKRGAATSPSEMTAVHLWAGKMFCELVINSRWDAEGLYVFNSAGLELLQTAKNRSMFTVMEQTIAPRKIAAELLEEEELKYPEWQESHGKNDNHQEACEREMEEWALSDVIVCGSQFVKDGIASCGGPSDRCIVVPYGVDVPLDASEAREHDGRLRVLTVGEVGLRKGSPYVLEAAKILKESAEFRMVGGIGILPDAAASLSEHVELMGSVARSDIYDQYRWADVLLLPSVCEGSATVTYEALLSGLPVVCTANAGSPVIDKVDGYIVDDCSVDSIVGAIELLSSDKALRAKMKENARSRSADLSMMAYGKRLIGVLEK